MITPETFTTHDYYRAEFAVKPSSTSFKFPLVSYLIVVAICIGLTSFLMGKANEQRTQHLTLHNRQLQQQVSSFRAEKAAYCQN